MNLTQLLASLPLWLSGFLVIAAPTALAMLCSAVVRRKVGLEGLKTNNEVAGFKFAVLGVIYAVLLGFAVIVVWDRFHDAETAVRQEAGVVATLYRLSEGLGADRGAALRDRVSAYANAALNDDWPAMARGQASPTVTRAVDDLYAAMFAEEPSDNRGRTALATMFQQLDVLTEARRVRTTLAEGVVPGVIWAVLLFGAVATVGFTFFFGAFYVSAQVLMTGLLTAMVFMGLLVIISIDHPFTGPVSVRSAPLLQVLDDFRASR